MIQYNHCSKQYIGETKRRLKDRFNEHRRPVDNPSNISKPTTVSEHFLTNDHSANDITLIPLHLSKSNSRERQCTESQRSIPHQEVKLLNHQVSIRKMKCNTVYISSICHHLFMLFLHFKFLSNHYFNGFCFQRSLFSHLNFTCYLLYLTITA